MTDTACILVVDDEPLFLQIYSAQLTAAGYRVITASNGDEAWREVQSNPEIDLIVSDVQMPGMDGYALCQAIRAEGATPDVPIIFVSGLTTLDEKMKGYAVGGDDYVIKPVVPAELLEKIRHLLEIRAKNAGLSAQLTESFNAAMQAMTYSSQLGQVIEFFKKSLSSDSLKEIADHLFEFMDGQSLHTTILFVTPKGNVCFSPQGEVSPLEVNVMEMARQKPRFFDFGARTIINYADFSLLIKNMPVEDEERYGTLKDTLGNLCEAVAARTAVLLSADREQQREQIIKTVQDAMDTLAKSLAQIQQANVQAMETMIADIDEAMMTLGLTETQEQNIRAIAAGTLAKVDEAFAEGDQLQGKFAAVQTQLNVVLG